jgi:hypothetical protein
MCFNRINDGIRGIDNIKYIINNGIIYGLSQFNFAKVLPISFVVLGRDIFRTLSAVLSACHRFVVRRPKQSTD